MSAKLKPCPFCGGETKIRTYSGMGRTMFFVQCNDCAAESSCYDTKEEAVAAWNRRAERTCHVIMTAKPFSQTQELRAKSCSSCGYIFESEEHRRMPPYYGEMGAIRATTLPNYCQCCGAKVER